MSVTSLFLSNSTLANALVSVRVDLSDIRRVSLKILRHNDKTLPL
jgi:hypothetical protein